MKKTLFVLSVFAAFALASCSSKSDCDCTISSDTLGVNQPLFTSDAPTFTDIDKNCDEINWDDIMNNAEYGDVWGDSGELGFTLSCVEH